MGRNRKGRFGKNGREEKEGRVFRMKKKSEELGNAGSIELRDTVLNGGCGICKTQPRDHMS